MEAIEKQRFGMHSWYPIMAYFASRSPGGVYRVRDENVRDVVHA